MQIDHRHIGVDEQRHVYLSVKNGNIINVSINDLDKNGFELLTPIFFPVVVGAIFGIGKIYFCGKDGNEIINMIVVALGAIVGSLLSELITSIANCVEGNWRDVRETITTEVIFRFTEKFTNSKSPLSHSFES